MRAASPRLGQEERESEEKSTKRGLGWKRGSVFQVETYGKVLQERRNEIYKVIKEKKHSTMFHSKNCKLFVIVEELDLVK